MRAGWLHFITIVRAQDPAFIERHFPRAAASMELYYAHRSPSAATISRASRAIAAWPWIIFLSPRRITSLALALLKAGPSILYSKSIETPHHV